jgi:hypothetical protein
MPTVQVRVLHMAGCPSTPPAIRLIEEAASALGVPITLESVLIETAEQAQRHKFLGSPSVRVEDLDIEPEGCVSHHFALT